MALQKDWSVFTSLAKCFLCSYNSFPKCTIQYPCATNFSSCSSCSFLHESDTKGCRIECPKSRSTGESSKEFSACPASIWPQKGLEALWPKKQQTAHECYFEWWKVNFAGCRKVFIKFDITSVVSFVCFVPHDDAQEIPREFHTFKRNRDSDLEGLSTQRVDEIVAVSSCNQEFLSIPQCNTQKVYPFCCWRILGSL